MKRRVAILGATGLVGRTMLAVLEQRGLASSAPRLLAGPREGRSLPYDGGTLPVEPVSPGAFDDIGIALFATSNALSQQWAPVARAAGATVVDNSSAFRYEDDVPLVVPEINGHLLDARPTLIANPNCSTIAVVMALAPLVRLRTPTRVNVTTFQSVSGAGGQALEALDAQTLEGMKTPAAERAAARPFAFNVIPQIGGFEPNGYTREEMKVTWETRKILALPGLPVSATAVRVPVRVGHSAVVTVCFDRALAPVEAHAAWAAFPGVRVVDDPAQGRFPTPLDVDGRDEVLVGRLRANLSEPDALDFFVVSDNLRKGAALNAVQIAERWCEAPGPHPAETR